MNGFKTAKKMSATNKTTYLKSYQVIYLSLLNIFTKNLD